MPPSNACQSLGLYSEVSLLNPGLPTRASNLKMHSALIVCGWLYSDVDVSEGGCFGFLFL